MNKTLKIQTALILYGRNVSIENLQVLSMISLIFDARMAAHHENILHVAVATQSMFIKT